MKHKRIMSLLLAALLAVTAITGCKTDDPQNELNDDTPTIEDPVAPVDPNSPTDPTEEPPVIEDPVIPEDPTEEPIEPIDPNAPVEPEDPSENPPEVDVPVVVVPNPEGPTEEPVVPEVPVEVPVVPEVPVVVVPPTEAPIEPTPPTEPYFPPSTDTDEKVDKEDQVEVETPLINVTKPENYVYPSAEILYLRDNLPKMDGSTSLILLETGIQAKIYDISFTEALARVNHTTTYGAFERLLNKEVNIIFSTPISKEQYADAEKKGMDLELIPIAAEAFVFIVNADNPVDSLTQQQIRDIYSGKITNWKEVGGEDIEIVAFQRNRTSGSQNYMTDFMGDTPLATAPTELVPNAMNSLVDAIKGYDNSHNAIGYSVYAYAADMYGLGDSLKFIKVDSVAPTKETMASKTYPLVNYNFAIYDKNSASEATLKTAAWLQSYDGQTAIAEAGYVPYGNVQREYLELSGTGTVKAENYTAPTVAYRAYTATVQEDGSYYADKEFSAYKVTYNKTETIRTPWKISGLTNKELEAEINAKLSDLEAKMDAKKAEVSEYLNLLTSLSTHTFNKTSGIYQEYFYESATNSKVEITVKNGYMCIIAGVFIYDGADREYCYHAEAVYYDLINGKEISFTDLFYKDVDIDKAIYEMLTQNTLGSYNQGFFLEAVPFSEITRLTSTEHFAMSFDKIYFTHDNPIFCVGEIFEVSLDSGYLCSDEPNDMEGIFEGNVTVALKYLGQTYDNVEYINVGHLEKYPNRRFNIRVRLLSESGENSDRNKKINDYVRAYVKDTFDLNKMLDLYKDSDEAEEIIVDNIAYTLSDKTMELIEYEAGFITLNNDSFWLNTYLIFDGRTVEVIDYTALLKDGWMNNITVENSQEKTSSRYQHTDDERSYLEKNQIPPNATFYAFGERYGSSGVPAEGKSVLTLVFECQDSGLCITVHVDSDFVKY